MDSTTIFKLATDVSHQDMGGDQPAVILRLSDGQLYTCNTTTRLFLEQVDGEKTMANIAAALHDVFEVELETLQADLLALAATLVESKLILPA